MPSTAFSFPTDLLPCPVATEITDELPSEFVFVSAFAPLVAQWRASSDRRHADFESLDDGADAGLARAAVLTPQLDARKIDRFCRLMTQEGWSTQATRMRLDPLYARDRLVLGYSSATSADLRRLALELFRLYEAQQVWH